MLPKFQAYIENHTKHSESLHRAHVADVIEEYEMEDNCAIYVSALSDGSIDIVFSNNEEAEQYFREMAHKGEWLWYLDNGSRGSAHLIGGCAKGFATHDPAFNSDDKETPVKVGEIPLYSPFGFRYEPSPGETITYYGISPAHKRQTTFMPHPTQIHKKLVRHPNIPISYK